jgi:hypothetical protein
MYRNNEIISITGRLNHNYAVKNTDFYLSIKQLNNLIGNVINEEGFVKGKPLGYDYTDLDEFNYLPRPITNNYMAYNKVLIRDLVDNPLEYTSGDVFTIPPFTTKIYKKMFSYTKFKEVIIPNSVIELKDNCFSNSSLEKIEIPLSIKTIPDMAFYNCKNLKNILLHDEIRSIKKHAFYSSGIRELRIPPKIKEINLKLLIGIKKIYLSKNTNVLDKYKTQLIAYYD